MAAVLHRLPVVGEVEEGAAHRSLLPAVAMEVVEALHQTQLLLAVKAAQKAHHSTAEAAQLAHQYLVEATEAEVAPQRLQSHAKQD